jgi:Leucine-rich repeat (LRR) protein
MFHLLVLLSLLATNAYDVTAISLDATLLTQLGFNNQSSYVSIDGYNISDIDPNAFKGYTRLTYFRMVSNSLSKLDLSVFKDSIYLKMLYIRNNPLTQLTNSKKIIFQFLEELDCYYNPLKM